ncbi:SPOR domain-containing protein [Sphingobium sp. AN558]|uniref:SPOR domain-containing protein n=1 Tax=Sphingobium sp. AN558 TaxID=3133442 RepID=UPI0030C0051D
MKLFWGTLAATVALGLSAPARADVKTGVDAWQQGDYGKAVAEWGPLARAGDADAQFNLGQAYKLGRGVQTDLSAALDWYRKAAAQGHLRAEDNLGLLMFQQGDRTNAMPYLQRSSTRGDARAQYIVGTALFNGDLLAKDWVRAYALMTRAASSGLTQATTSLQQMDKFVPEDQRKQGLALASSMEQQAARTAAAPSTPAAAERSSVRATQLPPSNINRPSTPPEPVRAAPVKSAPAQVAVARPKPAPAAPRPVPLVTASASGGSGGWRIQLGAFGEDGRARALWSSLTGKVRGLSAYQPYLVKSGNVTRLQAGPLASSTEAAKLCGSVKAAGSDCMPKKM